MKILSSFFSALAAAGVCAALFPTAAAAADWEFSSAANYETGKYGSKDRTDSVYIPFTLKHYYTNTDLSVTVPYLSQSTNGQITRVGGKPVRIASGNGSVSTSGEAGLGDKLVRGGYTLSLDGPNSCDLGLAGRLKLPRQRRSRHFRPSC